METVVLAAGCSKRMGGCKLHLPLKGEPLLSHALKGALEGSSRVIVVTSLETRELITPYLEQFNDRLIVVENSHPERGQFYSTQLGVAHLSQEGPFFLALGDLPLIRGEHYRQLLEVLSGWEVVRPFHQGNPGLPVMCTPPIALAISEAPQDSSVHSLLEGRKVYHYNSDDPAWVTDIDTPEAYKRLITLYGE